MNRSSEASVGIGAASATDTENSQITQGLVSADEAEDRGPKD